MAMLMQFGSGSEAVLIDVTPPAAGVQAAGVQAAGAADTMIKTAEASFDHVLRVAGVVAQSFRKVMIEYSVGEAELELGFQFTGKGTIYVVQSEAQAAIKVKLKFQRDDASTGTS